MAIAVDFFQTIDADVRVDLGTGEAFVTEEFLDDPEVGAAVEQVGGKGMAQGVRGDCFAAGQHLLHVFFDYALYAAGG